MSERGYESASKVWSGKDIVGIFHTLGITDATFNMLKVQLRSTNFRTPVEVRYLSMISTSRRSATTQGCIDKRNALTISICT